MNCAVISFLKKLGCLAILLFISYGCSAGIPKKGPAEKESGAKDSDKISVISTTAMIDDLVARIGKDRLRRDVLIRGDIDPHSYELVKGDDEKLACAQVLFFNGLGLEHGASLQYHVQHHACAIGLGDEIRKRHQDAILMVGQQIDPHIWMDISLWSQGIDVIVETLSKMDPSCAQFYVDNGKILKKEMAEAHEEIFTKLQNVDEKKRFLVTSHDAFNYFTRAYLAAPGESREQWQRRFDAPEGLAPDGQLSTADIQRMIDHLLNYRICVVFPESNVSRDSLKKIVYVCKEKGLDVKISKEILYGDAMGAADSDAGSYLKMIEHNAAVLIKEWQ